jgi:hypothetical protein
MGFTIRASPPAQLERPGFSPKPAAIGLCCYPTSEEVPMVKVPMVDDS